MRLTRLRIERAPGIRVGYEVTDLNTLNVIHGPNGSGKSTLVRALRAILWPESQQGQSANAIEARATFIHNDQTLLAIHRNGVTEWQADGTRTSPPQLPPPGLASCFYPSLAELLKADDASQLADEIHRELAGGFDLDALSRKFRVGNRGSLEQKAYLTARDEAVAIQQRHEDIAREEARLPDLRRELEEVRQRSREAPLLERAVELLREREELAEVEARFEAFPPGLDLLRGDEQQHLDRLHTEREKHEREVDDRRTRLSRLKEEREACNLPDGPIEPAVLRDSEARIEKLLEAEKELETARLQASSTQAVYDKATAGLNMERVLDPAVLDNLESFLSRSDALRSRRSQTEQEIRLVENELASHGDSSSVDVEKLQAALNALRGWLRTPAPASGPNHVRSVDIASGAFLLALGLFLTVTVHAAFIIVSLIGAAVAASPFIIGRQHGDARQVWVTEFESLNLSSLHWEHTAVEKEARTLESRLAQAAVTRRHHERLTRLRESFREIEAEEADLESQRMSLQQAVSFEGSSLSLAILARRIADATAAANALAQATAVLEAARTKENGLREQVLERFTALRLSPPTDGTAARTSLADLKSSVDRYRELSAELRRTQDAVDTALRDVARVNGEEAELWNRVKLEPGSTAELTSRLSVLHDFKELGQQVRDKRVRVETLTRAVSELQDRFPENESDALDRLEEARQASEMVTELTTAIAGLEKEIAILRGGVDLQMARARRDEAREALENVRSELMDLELASFLVESLREDYEKESRPPVLRRADQFFAAFTRHAYGLRLDRESGFRGIDHAAGGEGLPLSALSDGTRLQLLLAVKLAFAAEQQAAGNVPFVLDEALGNTDPARFEAIIDGLITLAHDENWQVFHLTSQPADVHGWIQRVEEEGEQPARIIDLAEVRQLSTAAPASTFEPPPATPPVPPPDGYTAEQYAEVLQVPVLDPFAGVDAQHVFHLLEDDLATVHRLVEMGTTTVGGLRSLASAGGTRGLIAPSEVEQRRGMMEAVFNAWKTGRSLPVPKHVLPEAGVTDAFIEPVEALVDKYNGNADDILTALANREVPRFRAQVIDTMREYFTENGYLSPVSPLDSAGIRESVLQQVPHLVGEADWGTSRILEELRRLEHRLRLQTEEESAKQAS